MKAAKKKAARVTKATAAQALCLFRIAVSSPDKSPIAANLSCQRAKFLDADGCMVRKGARALLASRYGDSEALPRWVWGLAETTLHAGIFVANADGTFSCSDCIPPSVDVSDDAVEVWEEGSHGWTGPCICATCKLSIPVYIDGKGIEE